MMVQSVRSWSAARAWAGNAQIRTVVAVPTLATSSYVVLGLLDRWGPSTPYGLDRSIRRSVGFFWSFPRSQVYSEASRLVRRGLVVEQREPDGRRRRMLEITPAGRAELDRWCDRAHTPDEATGTGTQIHDEGLLRLFFSRDGDVAAALAEQMVAVHRARLATYRSLMKQVTGPRAAAAATLDLGARFEELAVAFWQEVQQDPPGA